MLPYTSLCTNECTLTEDCVLPWQNCIYVVDQVYETCQYANAVMDVNGVGGCTAANDWLQPCNAAGTADGICLVAGTGDMFGLCTQAFTDGDGGPGAPCDNNANRQLGGFCDTSDVCVGSICDPVCNAGTTKTPACGAGLACVPVMDIYGVNLGPDTTNAVTSGACVTPCDTTILDAGACEGVTDQEPTKCMPAEYFGYAPNAYPDFCVGAAPAAQALPIGADCGNVVIGNATDVCVAGAMCYAPVINATKTCQQLCKAPFGKGAGGCPATSTCTAVDYGTASTETGVCVPPATTDGG
jgi:hypothetical protein